MSRATFPAGRGPFRADQIREKEPYELSQGHAIRCFPSGGRGSGSNLVGASVLASDPDVESAGVDTGYTPSEDTLRAPDVAVGNVPDAPGWVNGVPPLAVEYADTGQDEAELGRKVRELLAAGTRFLWVVRLTGPRRVEVHRPGVPMTLAHPGELLEAPGVLRNPVPVEALYDREAGRRATLRNLLQREGYESLDEVRAEGEASALRSAVLEVLAERGLATPEEVRAAVAGCSDPKVLHRWLRRAAIVDSVGEVIEN